MSDLTPEFNLDLIVARAKEQWQAEAQKRMSIQEKIAVTVPWWLLIIGAGLFALSAGHTVGVFNHLSPVGYAGPFVVEFSLLWAAFARMVARQGKGHVSLALRFLEVIAFIMAIAANGIGAASYIADRTQVAGQSWSSIVQSFGSLPFSTQLELLFVPLFALLIPVGTWATGEGIADLILTGRRVGSVLEQQWKEAEQVVVYRAVYSQLVRTLSPVDARKRATLMSAALSAGQRTDRERGQDRVKLLPERVARTAAKNRQGKAEPDARTKVREYLAGHPEAAMMTVRELAGAVGVSKTVAAEELARWKREH